MAKCVACRLGFFWECRKEGKCNEVSGDTVIVSDSDVDAGGLDLGPSGIIHRDSDVDDDSVDKAFDDEPKEFVTYKDDSALRDQQSTGRKRAAKMYPLDEVKLCEWAMKKNAGGGKYPITGCLSNLQQSRHHGPDKNTLNNEKGNVHRICHTCHNRWHTLNDEDYIWGDIQNEHEPQMASSEEVLANETWWEGRRVVRAKD